MVNPYFPAQVVKSNGSLKWGFIDTCVEGMGKEPPTEATSVQIWNGLLLKIEHISQPKIRLRDSPYPGRIGLA